jgi:hypothetical protein
LVEDNRRYVGTQSDETRRAQTRKTRIPQKEAKAKRDDAVDGCLPYSFGKGVLHQPKALQKLHPDQGESKDDEPKKGMPNNAS